MTAAEQAEVRQIVLDVLSEVGKSVEDTTEAPIVTSITDDDTTMPFVDRSDNQAIRYVQITVNNLATAVAGKIDPATAFPTKMESLTQAELDAILYPSDSSSE